jgi:hypothetical protein
MVYKSVFYAGAAHVSLSSGVIYNAKYQLGRVLSLATSGPSNPIVKLPDATTQLFHPGAPIFFLCNRGTQQVTIQDTNGGVLTTLNASQVAIICLESDATTSGVWRIGKKTLVGYG